MDIFLFELGLVGLGVSVKGKIMIIDRGIRDLGIFVKFVIYGGVVSKVGYIIIFVYIYDIFIFFCKFLFRSKVGNVFVVLMLVLLLGLFNGICILNFVIGFGINFELKMLKMR